MENEKKVEEKAVQRGEKNAFFRFLARKDTVFSGKRYGIDALGAMALGLFGSLLIGTIFSALGMIPYLGFLATVGGWAKAVSGPAMAVAIAYALKAPPLVLYSAAAVGYAANIASSASGFLAAAAGEGLKASGGSGGPLAVLLIAIVAVECGKAVSKETKVDILVTPFVTILVGGGLAMLTAPYISVAVDVIGTFIGWATYWQPFLMGLIVSVVVGIALTLPISSAAICAAIGLSGITALAAGHAPDVVQGYALAGGAAIAGCCAQMVGFAVMSFYENRWSGLVSQGLGTSMLQMPNIIRNPRIWIPPTVASATTGPLATCVFKLQMYGAPINSGMGTCGMLGPIGLILGWFDESYPAAVGAWDWIGLVLICLILPAVISWALCLLLRRIGWIRAGDLKLE